MTPRFAKIARPLLTCLSLALLLAVAGTSQAPGVSVPDQTIAGLEQEEHALASQIAKLAEAGKLLTIAAIEKQLKAPVYSKLTLPPPKTKVLSAADVATTAQDSFVRIGWCFLCTHCDNWHTELACGYAISAEGGIATCAHVLEKPPMPMRKGSVIAVDRAGTVHAITNIVANHQGMDAAIVRIDATLSPLAFDDHVRPGDNAYCFSRPLDQRGYFSRGMVNRFYIDQKPEGDSSLARQACVRLDVSTAWAPGSSGAAVLNARGNVIGHVSEIRPLNEGYGMSDEPRPDAEVDGENSFDPEQKVTLNDLERSITLLTTHVAIPARSVSTLASQTRPSKKATSTK